MGHLVTTLHLDQQALLDIARELLMYHVIVVRYCMYTIAFSALTLLVGRQEGHPACKKTEWWCAGVVICLERGADLHMAQRMPLPLTVSCFSKIQIGFTFLVSAYPGSPGQRAVKRVCVCVCVRACVCVYCMYTIDKILYHHISTNLVEHQLKFLPVMSLA